MNSREYAYGRPARALRVVLQRGHAAASFIQRTPPEFGPVEGSAKRITAEAACRAIRLRFRSSRVVCPVFPANQPPPLAPPRHSRRAAANPPEIVARERPR